MLSHAPGCWPGLGKAKPRTDPPEVAGPIDADRKEIAALEASQATETVTGPTEQE